MDHSIALFACSISLKVTIMNSALENRSQPVILV
jgi:hypothetical protein